MIRLVSNQIMNSIPTNITAGNHYQPVPIRAIDQ